MDLSEFMDGMLAIAMGLFWLALEIRLRLRLSRIEKWLAAHPLESEVRHPASNAQAGVIQRTTHIHFHTPCALRMGTVCKQ
jgi:hypothetical protein